MRLALLSIGLMIVSATAASAQSGPGRGFGRGLGGGFGGGFGGMGGPPAFPTIHPNAPSDQTRLPGTELHRNGAASGRMLQRFSSANTTHDGKLTLSQARSANLTAIARHFDEIDAEHKGYVTLDDVHAYRQRMMAERRAAQREPGLENDPETDTPNSPVPGTYGPSPN